MLDNFNVSTQVSSDNTIALSLLLDFYQTIPMPPHLTRLPDRRLSEERRNFKPISRRISLRTYDQAPHWIIAVFSRQFPDDIFRVSVATDTIGCGCSTYTIRNGTISGKEELPDYSREAYELAFQHFPLCRYRYVYSAATGTYREREPAELDRIGRLLHELGLI